jgi:hypothetical protein
VRQRAPVPVQRDDPAGRSEELSERQGECPCPGADVGPGPTGLDRRAEKAHVIRVIHA